MIFINLLLTLIATAVLCHFLFRSRHWRFYRLVAHRSTQLGWLAMLLISMAIQVASYIIMPKAKAPKPAAAREMDDPVAEAGKAVALVMGTVTATELNILGVWDKNVRSFDVSA